MKKILAVVLASVMALSLVACASAPAETAAPAAAPAATQAAAAAPAATEAAKEEVAEAPQGGFKIAYSVGYVGNAWRSSLVDSLQKVADDYMADGTIAEFQIVSADNDSTTQIQQCNALLADGLDALLICAVSPTTLTSVVDTALDMGTLLVLSNDPAVYEGTYCVVNDAYRYTELIDRWFHTLVPDGSNVCYISGNPGNGTDMLRDEQVYRDIEKFKYNMLAEAPGKRNQAEAQTVMSTWISKYPNIDGIMCQNTTAEGIMNAYAAAGVEPPIFCGDVVLSTLRKWQKEFPDRDLGGVTNSPGVGADSLHWTVLMLQGYELKDDALQANPLDATLINTCFVDPPVAITLDGTLPADILADYPLLTVYSRDEALEMYKDKDDTFTPDVVMTREQVMDKWFKAK